MRLTQSQSIRPYHEGLRESGIRTPERARELNMIREQGILSDLTRTREYVNAHSYEAAQHVIDVLNGLETDSYRFKAAESILDRTIGKAPSLVVMGSQELATDIIRELAAKRLARQALTVDVVVQAEGAQE